MKRVIIKKTIVINETITIDYVTAPNKPKPVKLLPNSKREIDMANFGFKIQLPAPGASDVDHRELMINQDGIDTPNVIALPGTALVTDELVYAADAKISVTLVDIDGHGNRSEASDPFVYTVVDDVAPPRPGTLGVIDKRQID